MTASSKGVLKAGVNPSLCKLPGTSPHVGKSEGSVRSIPPGVDPEWIWRKFLKEREKSKKLQVRTFANLDLGYIFDNNNFRLRLDSSEHLLV